MISDRLLAIVRCPDCRAALISAPTGLTCTGCGRRYARAERYLDLRPSTSFAEQTKYLDDALHADARHERVSPPLLGAGVRHRMLQRFLQLGPGDLVADLGCGSGRMMVWNRNTGAAHVGIDVSPHFAAEALADHDLVLGDLRQLPFAGGTFTKAYTLDVFEHLSRGALEQVLAEMQRVLADGGQLFAYSHVRKNSPLAAGLRAINALARGLEHLGLIDLKQERLRKSDHVNPLVDVPDLEAVVHRAGFRILRIRYYTPLIGGFVENILMRVAERALGRWRGRASAGVRGDTAAGEDRRVEEARLARVAAKERLATRGPLYYALRALTALMMLDIWVFGRIRTGPFFVLLERTAAAPAEAPLEERLA